MGSARALGQGAFAALLTLSVLMWSVMPATSHAPAILETLQEHAEMMAEHGHSHGLEEDLYWAMHGHGHDAADHDHSPAVLSLAQTPEPISGYRDLSRLPVSVDGPHRVFRIERPPRVCIGRAACATPPILKDPSGVQSMTTSHRGWSDPGMRRTAVLSLLALAALLLSAGHALAHNVTPGDAGYIQEIWGVNLIPFMYLGAKHMVTGTTTSCSCSVSCFSSTR